jgi:hypothetical protein
VRASLGHTLACFIFVIAASSAQPHNRRSVKTIAIIALLVATILASASAQAQTNGIRFLTQPVSVAMSDGRILQLPAGFPLRVISVNNDGTTTLLLDDGNSIVLASSQIQERSSADTERGVNNALAKEGAALSTATRQLDAAEEDLKKTRAEAFRKLNAEIRSKLVDIQHRLKLQSAPPAIQEKRALILESAELILQLTDVPEDVHAKARQIIDELNHSEKAEAVERQ